MAEPSATGARRVKVYVLNESDKWDDRGTGHVRCERDHRFAAFFLKVVAEDSGHMTMCSQVRPMQDAYYQMQEDTIISWQEDPLPNSNDVPTEIALSFAEADGCREIWDKICHIDSMLNQQQPQSGNKHMLSSNANSSQQHHQQQSQQVVSSHGLPGGTLSLPMSIVPHHNSGGPDPLVSTADSAIPPTSTTDNNLHRSHHNALVDASADIVHSSRFFDESLENPASWNADPIDDVIFRDNTNVLFLGSPGALVPPSTASDTAVAAAFVMPDPDRSGIEDLYRVMSEQGAIHVPAARERIISEVSNGDYVSKLCQVFRECEKSTDIEGLAMLYHVVRCFFIVGTGSVLEVLVHEKNLMDIVGCLEYDQEHIIELEHSQAEAKRCAGERSEKSAEGTGKEGIQADASAATSDKCKGACQSSSELANDEQGDAEKNSDHSFSEQLQKESKIKISVPATEKTPPQNDANHFRDDVVGANDGQGAKPKTEVAVAGDVEVCSDQHGEKVTPSEGVAIIDSSGVSNEIKSQCGAQKNLSEETTSSGNLVGDERRLVVRVHRDFLERKVSYKSVVPITDQNVVAKIHQNYRVGYIRDVILSRAFDESANSALSGVIVCNNVDIIMYFIAGSSALQELFDRLKSAVQQRQTLHRSRGMQLNRAVYQKEVAALGGTSDVDDHKECRNFSDDVCTTSPPNSESREKQSELEGNSDTSDLALSKGNTKTSYHSGMTGTTGESNATAIGDPSTSKDVSSLAVKSGRKLPNESATGGPSSSQSEEDIQRGLCSMLGLLRELCNVVKGQQPVLKNRFHALLTELGVLEVAVSLLLDKDPTIRLLCCDILSAAIIHDQTEVRSHILRNISQQEKADTKRIGVPLRSAPVGPQLDIDNNRDVPQQKEPGTHVGVPSGSDPEAQDTEAKAAESAVAISSTAAAQHSAQREYDGGEKSPQEDTDRLEPKGKAAVESVSPKTELLSNADADVSATGESSTAEMKEKKVRSATSQPGSSDDSDGLPSNSPICSSLTAPERGSQKSSGAKESTGSQLRWKATVSKFSGSAQADQQYPLLAAMVGVVCQDREGGVALTVLDLLRMLLDPTNMRIQSDKEVFLNVFYEKFISRLLEPIAKCVKNEEDRAEEVLSCGPDGHVSHICDLLSFCVTNHAYRGRYFVVGWDVGGRIAKLLGHRRAYIRLSALRFVRACVGMMEDILDRYIVGEKLFDPVMAMLGRNGNKDNLTSSAVLDVVNFIHHHRRFELLKHLLDKYSNVLEPTSKYCSAFVDARKAFEQLINPASGQQAVTDGTVSAKADGGSEDGTKGQMDVEMKPLDGSYVANIDDQTTKGEFGASGAGLRLVSGLLEQEIRMPHDQDTAEKFFVRCNPAEQAMTDFHSLVERAVSGGGQERGCNVTEGVSGGYAGKQGLLKNTEKPFKEQLVDSSKSRDALGDASTKTRDDGMFSQDKNPKRKPSLVGYTVDDSDEEDESGENGTERPARVKGGCPSGGSTSSGGIRLSLSRSEVRSGDVQLEDDTGVGICDTSDDSGSPRKRERSSKSRGNRGGRGRMADGGIETCTRAVMERQQNELGELDLKYEEGHEDSPPKRRRTGDSGSEIKVLGGSEMKVLGRSEVKVLSLNNHEALSKGKRKRDDGQSDDSSGDSDDKAGKGDGTGSQKTANDRTSDDSKKARTILARKEVKD